MKQKIKAFWVIVIVAVIGGWLWKGDTILNGNFKKDFVLGLDLAGGASLISYREKRCKTSHSIINAWRHD